MKDDESITTKYIDYNTTFTFNNDMYTNPVTLEVTLDHNINQVIISINLIDINTNIITKDRHVFEYPNNFLKDQSKLKIPLQKSHQVIQNRYVC